MKKAPRFLILLLIIYFPLLSQQPPATFQDPLLDKLVGQWVLTGNIGGAATTHDVNVAWVLGHQYMRIREVSREKDAMGQPQYEALVIIGWDQPTGQYSCLWLDNTGGGGLVGQAIGHAKRDRDKLAFLFKGADGSPFHTTFIYEKATDSWKWLMDNEEKGKLQAFARVKLTRKSS